MTDDHDEFARHLDCAKKLVSQTGGVTDEEEINFLRQARNHCLMALAILDRMEKMAKAAYSNGLDD